MMPPDVVVMHPNPIRRPELLVNELQVTVVPEKKAAATAPSVRLSARQIRMPWVFPNPCGVKLSNVSSVVVTSLVE
jgi:hypothetical protein